MVYLVELIKIWVTRVNSSGVVQSDTTGVGTARVLPAACGYSISA